MKLLWIWPWWLVLPVLAVGLTVCWLAWRDSSKNDRRWLRRALMVAVVAAMGMGPAVRTDVAELKTNAEVYFVVDTTGSMGAEDYGAAQRRIEGVREDIVAIAREYTGARFSIVRFDSRATRQLPLTTDLRAVESWAQTVKLEDSYTSQGSTVNRPVPELKVALERSAKENPGNIRILYLFSDGESTDSSVDPGAAYSELSTYVAGGAVLGYGTAEGGPMKINGGMDDGGYIIDSATGQQAISHLDEATLEQVAEQLSIPYAHRVEPGIDNSLLVGGIEDLLEENTNTRTVYNVQVWPLGFALLGLVLWEILATAPRLRGAYEVQRALSRGGRP